MHTTIRATLIGLGTATALAASPSAAVADASVDRVGPFVTVVPVAYADNPVGFEAMFAECAYVQRVERPDGSSVEIQHCQLTDPLPALPGSPPESAFTFTAGTCMWSSDYHLNTTGEVLVADEVRVTVTPSGEVTAKATFAPDPPPVSEC